MILTKSDAHRAVTIAIRVAQSLLDTIREAGPEGAPEGSMYAAFMTFGMSLDMFNTILDALVKAKKITRRGHCCFAVEDTAWQRTKDTFGKIPGAQILG